MPNQYEGYELIWQDEFTKDGELDTMDWRYEKGFVRNEELQWYQAENAFCEDGKLIIEGLKEDIQNSRYKAGSPDWRENREYARYSAASVQTSGKREFCYGRFEVKAKIPTACGAWPAIWTLGREMMWPFCGEIDIMEYYRIQGKPHILANVAWGKDQIREVEWDSEKIPFDRFLAQDPEWADKFHVWRMDWDSTAIRLYLDGELLNETIIRDTMNGRFVAYKNPFRQPHYLLLNLAIGGYNGGIPEDEAFPMRYEIDYVRVYKKIKTGK